MSLLLWALVGMFSGAVCSAQATGNTAIPVSLFTDTAAGTLEPGGGFGPGVTSGGSGYDLRGALFLAMQASGNVTIYFNCPNAPCTITLQAPLPPIYQANPNLSLTIDGGSEGNIIIDGNSGGGQANRVFFVDNVPVTLENLVIQNATAQGGAGGPGQDSGAGGGAGFGGGLFVNQTGAVVNVINTAFLDCVVVGGSAGSTAGGAGGGGGGGLGYTGGTGYNSFNAGGGGGVSGNGDNGYSPGGNGGNNNAGGSGGSGGGGGGYSVNGGQGVASSGYASNSGGAGANSTGGLAGFGGGGGGGATVAAGNGGFGGGGGSSKNGNAGNGGFGGGGGGSKTLAGTSATAVGGVQGGSGLSTAGLWGGGGGAAAGAAIFVVNGTVVLTNVTGANFSATPGIGSNGGGSGTANAASVFNYGGTVNGSGTVGPLDAIAPISVAVGQTSGTMTATVTFTTAGPVGTNNVYTQGAPSGPGQDFKYVNGGTCGTTQTAVVGATCTVLYQFAPTRPGLRLGAAAVVRNGSPFDTLATVYLSGVGTAPLVTFQGTTTVSTTGSGFSNASAVAVDGSGDVFVADYGHSAVKEIVATNGVVTSSSTVNTIATLSSGPSGVAVDGAGNVYAAEWHGAAVVAIPAVNGVVSSSTTPVTIASGSFVNPFAVTVDGYGNLYVADRNGSASKVYELAAVNGVVPTNATPVAIGSGFTDVTGVAVDANGNVFVSDGGSGKAYEIVAVNGVVSASSSVVQVGSGFGQPNGIAVDAAGDLFVSDYNNHLTYEVVAVNGVVNSSSAKVAVGGTGFSGPAGLAVDGSGHVFVSDYNNSNVTEVDMTTPPVVAFATATEDGTTDTTDGTNTLTVANTGNEPLYFAIPTTGTNPTTAADFTFATTGSGTCPSLTTSTGSEGMLAASASCTIPLTFTPVAGSSGALSESVVLTDNNANNNAAGTGVTGTPATATQTVTLKGTAAALPTMTSNFSPSTVALGGTVSFYVTLTNNSGVAITNGTGTVTLPAGLQFVNNSVGTGSSSGSSTGMINYSSASQTMTITGVSLLAGGNVTVGVTVTATGLGTQTVASTVTVGSATSAAVDASITVTDVATHFAIVGPTTAYPSKSNIETYTVQALDANNNVDTSYTGTVTLTNTDTSSYITSQTQTYQSGSHGSLTFVAGFDTLGVQTLTATDTSNAAIKGSLAVSVIYPTFLVANLTDDATGVASHCVVGDTGYDANNANCTLRDAAAAINAIVQNSGPNTTGFAITFLSSAVSVANPQTYNVYGHGPIVFQPAVTITGPGATALTIEGGTTPLSTANSQIFSSQQQGVFTISGVTLANGAAGRSGGGAIYSVSNLAATNCVFTGNLAQGFGGAISAVSVSVTNSTFTGNSSSVAGGALFSAGNSTVINSSFTGNSVAGSSADGGAIDAPDGTLIVSNSTFSNNTVNGASAQGGAIYANTVTVTNSTFTGDSSTGSSGNEAGAIFSQQQLTVSNSTFSGNSANSGSNPSYGGAITAGYSYTITDSIFTGDTATYASAIFGSSYGGSGTASNLAYYGETFGSTSPGQVIPNSFTPANSVNGNVLLSALGNYGGPTQTMLPEPGSAAICAGVAVSGVTTDQRGVAISGSRYGQTSCDDVGAVQTEYAMSFTTQPTDVAVGAAISPAPVVSVTENGVAYTAGAATVSVTDADNVLTTSPAVGTTSGGAATFGSLKFTSQEVGDSLTAALALSPSVSLTAGSVSFDALSPPTVTGISPNNGPTTGGPTVTITGTNFAGTSVTVSFGGTPGVVQYFSTTTLYVTLPAHAAGPVTVTLTTAGGSASAPSQFTYVTPAVYSYLVTTLTDDATGTPGNCVAGATGTGNGNSNCSLRDAVAAANLVAGPQISTGTTIGFLSGLGTVAHPGIYNVQTNGTITIQGSMTIDGPGANLLTIEGGATPLSTANAQIFLAPSGTANVVLSGMTLANGYRNGGDGDYGGGAIFLPYGPQGQNNGSVTVTNTVFKGNLTDNSGQGGAICTFNTPVTATNSTFSGNQASGQQSYGGAIIGGSLMVSDSTFLGNESDDFGGALLGFNSAVVRNSTFSGNTAGNNGGAIYAISLTVSNSVFTGDSTNNSVFGGGGSTATNIVLNGDTIGQYVTATNVVHGDPILSALGNYGGTTPTMLPAPGSAAICAGATPTVTTDQRGVAISGARYGQTGCYDVGAVQTEYVMSFGQQPSNVVVNTTMTPAPTVLLKENGTSYATSSPTIAMTDVDGVLTAGGSAASSGGVTSFSALAFGTPETSDTLTAALTLNANANPAAGVSVTSGTFSVVMPAPTISFQQPASPVLNGAAVLMTGTSSATTIPITYTVSGPAIVSGSTVTFTGDGTVTITATQPANSQYAVATPVSVQVSVIGGYIWLVNADSTRTKLYQVGTVDVGGIGSTATASTQSAIAFDGLGMAWSVASSANVLSFANSTGLNPTTATGGGLSAPVGVAVDGLGYVWVANSGNSSISEFTNAGAAVTASTGYATDTLSTPAGIAIDSSGSLWVTDEGSDSVTKVLGAAAPVITPIVNAVTNNTLGARP